MRRNQRVIVVGRSAKVVGVGKKKQGGAWVLRLWVRYDDTGCIRRALAHNAAKVV